MRDAVGAGPRAGDAAVVRTEGGDDVFGVDERAEQALLAVLREQCGHRWPGTLVMEGFDEPLEIGGSEPYRYLADPVDGSRPWLAGKRSAWVLLGAGRHATTLADLEVGACVELPTPRAALGMVGWAVRNGGPAVLVDDDLVGGTEPAPNPARPRAERALTERVFVSIQRFVPGQKAALGAWEDELLAGRELYEDPYLCSGGQLMEVVCGRELAVLDPRPLVVEGVAAHPYDLAAWVVAAQAGVVVEALPPGPLLFPLDTTTPVAWAAYANEGVAAELRALIPRRATPAPARP